MNGQMGNGRIGKQDAAVEAAERRGGPLLKAWAEAGHAEGGGAGILPVEGSGCLVASSAFKSNHRGGEVTVRC